MQSVTHIYSNRARSAIIRALLDRPTGLGTRELAATARVSIGSVQHALPDLIAEQWIIGGSDKRYRINSSAPLLSYVKAMSATLTYADIAARAEALGPRAQSTIAFYRDAQMLLAKAKDR